MIVVDACEPSVGVEDDIEEFDLTRDTLDREHIFN